MDSDQIQLGSASYPARITPLKTGGRRDVEIGEAETLPAAFMRSDIISQLRRFFADLEAEASDRAGDPVALSQALARMEALLADVRYVRDSMRSLAAEALADERIRRLTVLGVATVEASSEIKRSEWQHNHILSAMLAAHGMALLHLQTGEIHHPEIAAETLLAWFRPEWRMTALREAGLNPDQFCTVASDDDGRPIRTPAIRIVDNIVRRITTPTTTQETDQ